MKLEDIREVIKKHNLKEINELLRTGWVILAIEPEKETSFILGRLKNES